MIAVQGEPDMSDYDTELLNMLLDRKVTEPGVRDLPPAKRKAYQREAVARHREVARKARVSGVVEPTTANVQQALADAALMLLAVGGPGSDQVRAVLRSVFKSHAGTPLTVEAHARGGQLKPKLFKVK